MFLTRAEIARLLFFSDMDDERADDVMQHSTLAELLAGTLQKTAQAITVIGLGCFDAQVDELLMGLQRCRGIDTEGIGL